MAVQKIEKGNWRAFFDWLSQGLLGARAEIEVASLDLGDQIEAEWLTLLGITYDDEVIGNRGVSQIIKLRQPLMLPSPSPLTARD